MAERVLVRNANDPQQVAAAKETVALRAARERDEWITLLSTPIGRARMFAVLARCHVFESIMETNARIYYNAGQQDLGHWLMAELGTASPALYLLMQQEAGKLTTELAAHAEPTSGESDQ